MVKIKSAAETIHNLSATSTMSNTSIASSGDGMISLLDNTRVQKLILCAPVVNSVLAKANGDSLARLLTIPSNQRAGTNNPLSYENIINGSIGLRRTNAELPFAEMLHAIEHIPDPKYDTIKDWIVAGNLLKLLVDNYDIEYVRDYYAHKVLSEIFVDSALSKGNVTLTTNKTPFPLVSNYYLNVVGGDVKPFLKASCAALDYYRLVNEALEANEGILEILCNMPSDGRSMRAFMQTELAIVPPNMRMQALTMGRKEHPLTELYKRVMADNLAVRTYTVGIGVTPSVESYVNVWNKLNTTVTQLQAQRVTQSSRKVDPGDISLLERIKTKHGHVRKYCFGKRQDYSARSVVTVDPYLSLDRIRIPKEMIPSLFEYHALPYVAEALKTPEYEDYDMSMLKEPKMQELIYNIIIEHKILERVPIYMGRQPTLHRHSFQGFYVEPSDTLSIVVNPLICPGYNMDFDGDQAHLQAPLSEGAIIDVRDKMLSTRNILLPKTGKSTIAPRQDMIYGLYLCTREETRNDPRAQHHPEITSVFTARDMVEDNVLPIWDTVSIGGHIVSAGDAAFMGCFIDGDVKPYDPNDADPKKWTNGEVRVATITSKNIAVYVNHILGLDGSRPYNPTAVGHSDTRKDSTDSFVGCINHLVRLGFKVAYFYPPSISLVDPVHDVTVPYGDGSVIAKSNIPYSKLIDTFYKDCEEIDFYYQYGMMEPETYHLAYASRVNILADATKDGVNSVLAPDDGYKLMSKSGARGSAGNLVQLFEYKGQIAKNSTESFSAIVENSYYSQITPMEHFICAYGGRQGQMDKSLKTGDTGYAERRMWHIDQAARIVCEDCGATEGIKVSYKFYADHFLTDGIESKDIIDIIRSQLRGHYRVGDTIPISNAEALRLAKELASTPTKTIEIRSVLKCKKPYCAHCYGIDPSTMRPVQVGVNVGVLAAQSIGEPATQLTMKQFQKGGVASAGNSNSAFDRIKAYLTCKALSYRDIGYDPVAWASGAVRQLPCADDVTLNEVMIEGSPVKVKLPKSMILVTEATKGVGLSAVRGDYSVRELLAYSPSFEDAQKYLVSKFYAIYKQEEEIISQHFEVLVGMMTRYRIIQTDRHQTKMRGEVCIERRLLEGGLVTPQEYYCGNTDGTIAVPTIVDLDRLYKATGDALESLTMERLAEGLRRAVLLELDDTLEKPLNRVILGRSFN